MSFVEQVIEDPVGRMLDAWLKVEQARLDRKLIESRMQAESYMQPSYAQQQAAKQPAQVGGMGAWVNDNPALALVALVALGAAVWAVAR